MASSERADHPHDACPSDGSGQAAQKAGRARSGVATADAWRALITDDPSESTATREQRRQAWEELLLARWSRLNLLLTILQPVLPEHHPRLHLVRVALFSTFRDLQRIGVSPAPNFPR